MVFKNGIYEDNTKELKKLSVKELKDAFKDTKFGKGIKTTKLKKKELVALLDRILDM